MCLLFTNYYLLHTQFSWKLKRCDWSEGTSCYNHYFHNILSLLFLRKRDWKSLLCYNISYVNKLLKCVIWLLTTIYIIKKILMRIEIVWLGLRKQLLLHYFHHILILLFLKKKLKIYTVQQNPLLRNSRDVSSVY